MESGESGASTPAPPGQEQHLMLMLVLVLLRDRAGAIELVMGLLRRRASSVTAMSFVPSEKLELLRVTIALRGARAGIEHVVNQLRKLEDVYSAEATPAAQAEHEAVVREMAAGRIENVTTGQTFQAQPYPESILRIIRAGGLIAATREKLRGAGKLAGTSEQRE